MTIGILTFHRSYNYGAFLQCYSLQKRLRQDFPNHKIEVIDYTPIRVVKSYELEEQTQQSSRLNEQIAIRNRRFRECLPLLPLSDKEFVSDTYDTLIQYLNDKYDVVIVGSDAVFNFISKGFPNAYFLDGFRGKKMSYAASCHGMDFLRMTPYQKEIVRKSLSDFSYIGVRDVTTEEMARYVDEGLKVCHNCDPTLLLDIDDLPVDEEELRRKFIAHGVDFSKPVIGLMGDDACIGQEISRRYRDCSIVSLYRPNCHGTFLYDLNPFEWAKAFTFYDVTFTHFFHGTMLSLKSLTPVFPIECRTEFSAVHKTKIRDAMERLMLDEWCHETNYSRLERGLRRIGFFYDFRLWNDIFKKVDELKRKPASEKILNGLIAEQQSYNSFKDSLQNIVKEKGND